MEIRTMKPGERGMIVEVKGEGAMRKRLLDMGLTPNTVIELYKRAPMGDPVELIVRGYHLTLRLHETDKLLLVPAPIASAPVSEGGSEPQPDEEKKEGVLSRLKGWLGKLFERGKGAGKDGGKGA